MNLPPLGRNLLVLIFWEKSWVHTLPSGFLYRLWIRKTRTGFAFPHLCLPHVFKSPLLTFSIPNKLTQWAPCVFKGSDLCVLKKPKCLGHLIWQTLWCWTCRCWKKMHLEFVTSPRGATTTQISGVFQQGRPCHLPWIIIRLFIYFTNLELLLQNEFTW